MDHKIINPYKLFTGAFLPNWLLEYPGVSLGAKVVYARLCQYANTKSGIAYPRLNTLAKNVSLSREQLKRYIRELRDKELIHSDCDGKTGVQNKYTFLEHEAMGLGGRSDMTPPLLIDKIKEKDNNICEVSSKLAPSSVIKSIFEHWQKVMSHPRAKLDDNRKNIIRIALEKDYTEDELKIAIDGCSISPYHMENGHDGLGLILRNAEKIEKFIGYAENGQADEMFPDSKTAFQNCIAKRGVPSCAENAYRLAIVEVGGNRTTLHHMREEKAQAIFDKYYSLEKSKQRKRGGDYE